jgi:hypothetical protein
MSPPHACAIGAHRPIDYPIEQIMLSCAPDPDWTPEYGFFGWVHAVVFQITSVPAVGRWLVYYQFSVQTDSILGTDAKGTSSLCKTSKFVIWNTAARAPPKKIKTFFGVYGPIWGPFQSRAHGTGETLTSDQDSERGRWCSNIII